MLIAPSQNTYPKRFCVPRRFSNTLSHTSDKPISPCARTAITIPFFAKSNKMSLFRLQTTVGSKQLSQCSRYLGQLSASYAELLRDGRTYPRMPPPLSQLRLVLHQVARLHTLYNWEPCKLWSLRRFCIRLPNCRINANWRTIQNG